MLFSDDLEIFLSIVNFCPLQSKHNNNCLVLQYNVLALSNSVYTFLDIFVEEFNVNRDYWYGCMLPKL